MYARATATSTPVAGHYTVVDADLGEEWPDVEQADLGQHE